jgi:hypothetical protein
MRKIKLKSVDRSICHTPIGDTYYTFEPIVRIPVRNDIQFKLDSLWDIRDIIITDNGMLDEEDDWE